MGTGNGVIISVPLTSMKSSKSAEEQIAEAVEKKPTDPADEVKIYADNHTDKMTLETFVPYCSMSQAQLSFHGHRDAVKFFVSVPGQSSFLFHRKPLKNRTFSTGHGGLSNTARIPSSSSSNSVNKLPAQVDMKAVGSLLVMSGGEGYIDFRIGKPPQF